MASFRIVVFVGGFCQYVGLDNFFRELVERCGKVKRPAGIEILLILDRNSAVQYIQELLIAEFELQFNVLVSF
jgi:hypothetical protein